MKERNKRIIHCNKCSLIKAINIIQMHFDNQTFDFEQVREDSEVLHSYSQAQQEIDYSCTSFIMPSGFPVPSHLPEESYENEEERIQEESPDNLSQQEIYSEAAETVDQSWLADGLMEIPQPADFFEDELILPSFTSIPLPVVETCVKVRDDETLWNTGQMKSSKKQACLEVAPQQPSERISQAQQISRAKNLPNIFFIRLKKILMAFKNELPQDIVDLLESTPSLENCRELLKCPQARPIVKERFLVEWNKFLKGRPKSKADLYREFTDKMLNIIEDPVNSEGFLPRPKSKNPQKGKPKNKKGPDPSLLRGDEMESIN